MKRPFDYGGMGGMGSWQSKGKGMEMGGKGSGGDKQMRGSVGMAVKMLVSPKEASSLIGKAGSVMKMIQDSSGASLHLSGVAEFYPGTQMQEVSLKADTADQVANGILQVLMKLSEETGKVLGGEWDVEEGGARIHFIVPTTAARNLIGRGGETIKMVRQESGMKCHVEEVIIGDDELAEQVVSLAGPLSGVQGALPIILDKVQEMAMMPWFTKWAFMVQAAQAAKGGKGGKGPMGGIGGKGAAVEKGKGMPMDKGKGKGWDAKGWDAKGWDSKGWDSKGWDAKGWDAGNGKGKGGFEHGFGGGGLQQQAGGKGKKGGKDTGGGDSYSVSQSGAGVAATQENIDMLSSAVSAMPPALANSTDRSQVLQFSVQENFVSALIGKAGSGTKQIAINTDTKIMLREVDGSQDEKQCVIKGNAINVASAYLQVASRLSNIQKALGGGGGDEVDPIAAMMGMP